MATVIAVGNQKGGVGKTTTVMNLGFELVQRGRTVVMVDVDPQASLTVALGFEEQAIGHSLAEVVGDSRPGCMQIRDVLVAVEAHLFLVPSDIALSAAELGLIMRTRREEILKRAIAPLAESSRIDYVLLDCPPNLGLLTTNALVAADQVLVPMQLEYLSLRGFQLFYQTILQARKEFNPRLRLVGILPTFYRVRTKHHGDTLDDLRSLSQIAPILEPIPQSIIVADSQLARVPVARLRSDHQVAHAYRSLAKELDRE